MHEIYIEKQYIEAVLTVKLLHKSEYKLVSPKSKESTASFLPLFCHCRWNKIII